jgi:hypothetical protein
LRAAGLDRVDTMEGAEFEEYVAAVLRARGYQASLTKKTGDFGVDIVAVKGGVSTGIQCKRQATAVGAAAVQQVVAGAVYYGCTEVMVVTNRSFTRAARELAQLHRCRLVGRDELLDLIGPLRYSGIDENRADNVSISPASSPTKSARRDNKQQFWSDLAITPIEIWIGARKFLTLRCYIDGEPVFLGSTSQMYVFRGTHSLSSYLAARYSDSFAEIEGIDAIRERAASPRGLGIYSVPNEHRYVLSGLGESLNGGAAQVDRTQLKRALELFEEVADYFGQTAIARTILAEDQPLGLLARRLRVRASIVSKGRVGPPRASDVATQTELSTETALLQYQRLETFLESKLFEPS